MKAIIEKKSISLSEELPVEGRIECEASIEGNTLKVVFPQRETSGKVVERALRYLEHPDSECDIETMSLALEVDAN